METFVNESKETFKLVQCSNCKKEKEQNEFKIYRGNYTKTCIECLINKKSYRCQHGKQCKSKCKDCLGISVNKGKCSRCKKKFDGDELELFNGKPLQTCLECRYKSNCPHNQRIKKNCKICKNNYTKELRIRLKCIHSKRNDICIICNPIEALKSKMRIYVSRAIKQKRGYKSSIKYIGCSVEKLKEHLEKQFKEGMTWENHGKWHIDHIIPVKYKENGQEPTLEEVIKRLHYTNLQPLWAEENMSKGNRYIG